MPFAALDDEFFGHPKTAKAGLDGAGLYTRSLSYVAHYLTDGFVPAAWVSEIAKPAVRKKVTDAGFWIEVSGGERFEYAAGGESYTVLIAEPGFFIPDYLQFNPTRASVLETRNELSRKRSEAGKKGALVRWQRQRQNDGKPHSKTMATGMATDWQTDGPLPLPHKDTPRAVTSYETDTAQEKNIEQVTPTLREIT